MQSSFIVASKQLECARTTARVSAVHKVHFMNVQVFECHLAYFNGCQTVGNYCFRVQKRFVYNTHLAKVSTNPKTSCHF